MEIETVENRGHTRNIIFVSPETERADAADYLRLRLGQLEQPC